MMSRAERRSLASTFTRQLLCRAPALPARRIPASPALCLVPTFARVRPDANMAAGALRGAPARQSCRLWARAEGAETGGAAGAGVRRVAARAGSDSFEEEVVEMVLPLPIGAGGVSGSASLGLTDCSQVDIPGLHDTRQLWSGTESGLTKFVSPNRRRQR